MSQALSIRRLSFLFLLLVLESHAKSVADDSFFLKPLTNSTVNKNSALLTYKLSTESSIVSRPEDEDPVKSSGSIVYNRFAKPSRDRKRDTASEEESEGPPDHDVPYSEHEEPRNVPTKPKYRSPGEWARPPKDRDSSLESVPSKLYAQVRKTHTVRRLPRKKAIENAESEEERENAARLREVVRNSKVNTVYTEEGYEDSAYDHAGHIRDADFHEGYARKLHDQMNARKNTEDGVGNDKKEIKAESKNYKVVDPAEFEAFNEDYSDHYETTTDYKRIINGAGTDTENKDDKWEDPKVVAVSGIQKLQEDLDKEAEEAEKDSEISRLERVVATTDRESSSEPQSYKNYSRKDKQGKKKSRKQKKATGLGEHYEVQANENIYTDNYSTTPIPIDEDRISTEYGSHEATTMSQQFDKYSNDPSESYKYEVEGNPRTYTEAIEFQSVEDNPTSANYGQIVWDYFKARQNPLITTQVPIIFQPTTLSPHLLQGNVNRDLTYSVYTADDSTSMPIVESVVLSPQKFVTPQTFSNPEYSLNNEQRDQLKSLEEANLNGLWQSVTINEPTTPINQYSEIYDDKAVYNEPQISLLNTESNLDSEEQFGKTLDNSFFNPTLNSLKNRKLKYKITVRQKPKTLVQSNEEASSSNSISKEKTTPQSIILHENYMKVLNHLRKEERIKNVYPKTLQEHRISSLNNENRLKDLTKLRPPPPQKASEVSYQNYLPRKTIEKDSFLHPVNSFATLQQIPSRQRSLLPSIDLFAPALSSSNEHNRHKETDYLTRSGNKSKQGRNIPRVFRQISFEPIKKVRGKRRERRSAWREENEPNGTVKGVRPLANNGTSNRGEIERAAKNPSIERNPQRKVTRGVEVGLVPDTSSTKQPIEKKSRSNANDRREGSISEGSVFVEERESKLAFVANGSEGRNGNIACNFDSLRCDDANGKDEIGVKLVQHKEKPKEKESSNFYLRNDQDSLNEEHVIGEGLFNQTEEKHNEDLGSISRNSAKQKRNADEEKVEMKTDSRSMENRGTKSHEELLEESPKIAGDVIDKEIEARFNGNDNEEEDGEKNVEVEVPEFDYVEEIPEEDQADIVTTEATVDLEKYPFYENEKIPAPSALKYAIDPERIPRKTQAGMEFYKSRDIYKHCDEVEPNLEVVPNEEKPVANKGPTENVPRLRGLGEKLDCFKAKYFDDNPFDNPLFLEKEVEEPTPPTDFDTKEFASRIMMFPKEDDDYVIQKSSRRPENYQRSRELNPSSVRIQKTSVVRYKTYPRVVRRKRPRIYRIKGSNVKYVKTRRPQQYKKRPLSSASEISSSYTPYQNQVYEDVMGTIKNMANSYQVQEVTTLPSSEESTVIYTSNDTKLNTLTNSTNSEKKKEKDSGLVSITEHPKVGTNIEGMKPPKYPNRHRVIYRRNRIPRKNKSRIQLVQKPITISRASNYRQKIRIYRRSVRNDENMKDSMESAEYSGELSSKEETTDRVSAQKSSSTLKSNEKSRGVKEKSKNPKNVLSDTLSSVDGNDKKEKTQRTIYTIKDRIRHSKPKGEVKKVGKFTNETKVDVDQRRKEPRYNYIKRKRPRTSTTSTTETSFSELTDNNSPEPSLTTSDSELDKENNKIQSIANSTEIENSNSSEKLEDQFKISTIELSNEQNANKTKDGYAVHENVNEEELTTTQKPQLTTLSAFSNLMAFLDSDTPAYTEPSSEEFRKSMYSHDNSSNFSGNSDSTNSKEVIEKGDKESESKNSDRSKFFNEESSEKTETGTKIPESKESSEESNASSTESDSAEGKTFFKYEGRPSSPAENYEDEKYSDIGPRVNKPSFFHPPFSFSSYKKLRPSSSEENSKEPERSYEEEEDHVFPWYKDKEDKKKSNYRHRGKFVGDYEFPWERRARLEREEKRKRLTKKYDDEEEGESFVRKHRRNIYPRQRYRYWNRGDRDILEDSIPDNVESSSEYRPIMKYSSRYNSGKVKLPTDSEAASVRSTKVKEISESIQKALNGDSEEKTISKETSDSSEERKPSVTLKNRGISMGMIVPEDVTLAPRKRTLKKETLKSGTALKNEKEIEGRNSGGSIRNSLDNSESQIVVSKTNPNAITNSSKPLSKRRRRPVKDIISKVQALVKAVTETNRSRRRQRVSSTTPATITSTSTTKASRIVRRRNQKTSKDTKKSVAKSVNKLTNNERNNTETLKSQSKMLKGKQNDGRISALKEELNNAAKYETDSEISPKYSTNKVYLKMNQEGSKENENAEKIFAKNGEVFNVDAKKIEKQSDSKETFPFVKGSDEDFEFKKTKAVSSNFDKSDSIPDDDKSDKDDFSTLKSNVGFAPPNRAVQLTEQGSREVVSSVSWISENYDF